MIACKSYLKTNWKYKKNYFKDWIDSTHFHSKCNSFIGTKKWQLIFIKKLSHFRICFLRQNGPQRGVFILYSMVCIKYSFSFHAFLGQIWKIPNFTNKFVTFLWLIKALKMYKKNSFWKRNTLFTYAYLFSYFHSN